MTSAIFACSVGLASLACKSATAQEVAAYGLAAQNKYGPHPARGIGASLSGTIRLGSVFGRDAGPLQRSNMRVGLRFAFNELWYQERSRGMFCTGTPPAMSCVDPASRYVHFQIGEASAFFLPYASRRTRVEIGAGIAHSDPMAGVFASVAASRRLFAASPLWASVGWQPRKWTSADLADASRPMRPAHSVRVGLELSRAQ
jgi:hypothetical protein